MQNALARVSVADYLAGELRSEVRHEYIDGEVYAMSGASRRHSQIVMNLASAAHIKARGTGCTVFSQSMKLGIASLNILLLPGCHGKL
ncbi:MAG: Uma2 family endonuclease [Nevskia sp.]|nr:Uma2 family endonuclease [Nevskia sp.]